MQNRSNVIIKYSDDKQKIGHHSNEKEAKPISHELSKIRELRAISIIIFTISILIFLSLVSYSPSDNVFTNISLKEIFSNIINHKTLSTPIEISNWLGIIGAVISDFLINSTIGYATILIPLFLIIAAKNLFFHFTIKDSLIRLFIVYLILAFSFSITMATLSISGIIANVPNEWHGIAGYFLAQLFIKLIGVIGTLIVQISISALAIIIGTNLNIDKILKFISSSIQWISKSIHKLISSAIQIFRQINIKKEKTEKNKTNEDEDNENSNSEDTILIDDDEPAKVIRRNLNISINKKIDTDTSNGERKTYETEKIIITQAKPVVENRIQQTPQSIENKSQNSSAIINYKKKFVPPEQNDETLASEVYDTNEKQIKVKIEDSEVNSLIDILPAENIFEIERKIKQDTIQSNYENISEDYEDIIEPETQNTSEENPIIAQNENYKESPKSLTLTIHSTKNQSTDISTENIPIYTSQYDEEIDYTPPPTSILIHKNDENYIDEEELQKNATILQEKLGTFKIYIENLSVTPGPVVTQYEFIPAAGIKISKIESLADDLAMALKARGIRIIAPIPGKGTVGIEIPNQKPSIVRFSSIVCSQKFRETNYKLPLALGKTISGEVYITDLAKMPHLLIAGATGAGKSVGINTIIASLIYKIHPRDLKFVIIDPKKVELNQYAKLENHFLAKSPDIDDVIITNPKDAVLVLNSVVAEMESRYDLLAMVGQRNINDYNDKLIAGKLNHSEAPNLKPMPYIVVIIDELADLMMTAAKEIEEPITRLAQMARAVGIHLVVATQRPSVDVITGIIKANFPARIAYLVAQKVDSRTILDVMGAEQLLGNGDMLFLPSGSPKPIRLQNSFISSDEVDEICNFIGQQKGFTSPYMLPSLVDKRSNAINGNDFDRDPLFEEAARLVVRHQQGSASLIQRRLKVGYARAGRIIDELEAAGIIGPYEGSKARQVLIESEAQLDAIL